MGGRERDTGGGKGLGGGGSTGEQRQPRMKAAVSSGGQGWIKRQAAGAKDEGGGEGTGSVSEGRMQRQWV
jgi:hypothetical protein